ncbi:hypothetical protein O6H91_01G060900 [Diphasiastrum complanatum]|uniref:Uncharacterized protein n=1 Tax=Diphasiastrum complanatum TaxID=34168 RepID=A0ACC2ERJ0_DIPCM|nr:hypothetical protein O6H91_01G060900 [Diphasiastrum complanatum]
MRSEVCAGGAFREQVLVVKRSLWGEARRGGGGGGFQKGGACGDRRLWRGESLWRGVKETCGEGEVVGEHNRGESTVKEKQRSDEPPPDRKEALMVCSFF